MANYECENTAQTISFSSVQLSSPPPPGLAVSIGSALFAMGPNADPWPHEFEITVTNTSDEKRRFVDSANALEVTTNETCV